MPMEASIEAVKRREREDDYSDQEDEPYTVKEIVGQRKFGELWKFQVLWDAPYDGVCTWERMDCLLGCPALLYSFRKRGFSAAGRSVPTLGHSGHVEEIDLTIEGLTLDTSTFSGVIVKKENPDPTDIQPDDSKPMSDLLATCISKAGINVTVHDPVLQIPSASTSTASILQDMPSPAHSFANNPTFATLEQFGILDLSPNSNFGALEHVPISPSMIEIEQIENVVPLPGQTSPHRESTGSGIPEFHFDNSYWE